MELSGTATKMEVKPGYKKTEVGVIPEEWVILSIGEVTSPSNRRMSPKTSLQSYKCIELEHISQETGSLLGYANSAQQLSQKTIFSKGDVLFGKLRPYLRKYYFAKFDGVCSTEIWVLTASEKILSKYLFYLIQTGSFIDVANQSTGTRMPRAEWRIVKELKIPLPPTLAEQRAIATALSEVGQLITALGRLIDKKKAMKQGAMQELLTGRKRLPAFATDSAGKPGVEEKDRYKETEVGGIPKDWDAVPIGDHFDFKNGLNKAKEFFGRGTPIVNYMDVFKFPGLRTNNILGKVTLTPDEIRNYSAKKGDVFFTRTSETVEEIGMASVLLQDVAEGVFSGFVLRARPKSERFDLHFRQYCFRSEVVRKQITSTSSYTTRALTNGRLLSKVFIPLPPTLDEQRAIAQVLSDMDAETEALEQKRDKYKAIKQGMMQELLTGKTRLV